MKTIRLFIISLILIFILGADEVYAQVEEDTLGLNIEQMMLNHQYREVLNYIDSQEAAPHLIFQKAMCYKALERYGDALTILHRLTNEDVENIRYNSEIADCYVALFNWKKGANTYEYLARLDSSNIYFKTQYGNMLLKLGEYEKALPVYDAIYNQHGLESIFKYKAECFENINMLDSAMIYYEKAWKINDYDTYSLANFINLNIKTGKLAEAVELSDTFIEQDSTNRFINRLNAIAYYTTNLFYEEAVKRFERCVRQGDNSLAVSKGLGMCYYTLDSLEKAYPHLTRAYMADSTNLNNLYPLAVVCNGLEKNEEAIKYYNKVLEIIVPNQVVLYLNYKGLAEAYKRAEQYDDAMTNYLLALKNSNDERKMNLYYDIATMCMDGSHSYKDAIFYYEKYQDMLQMALRMEERVYENPKAEPLTADGSQMISAEEVKAEAGKNILDMKARLSHLDKHLTELKSMWNAKLEEELSTDAIYAKKNSVDSAGVDYLRMDNIKNDSIAAKLREKGIYIDIQEM